MESYRKQTANYLKCSKAVIKKIKYDGKLIEIQYWNSKRKLVLKNINKTKWTVNAEFSTGEKKFWIVPRKFHDFQNMIFSTRSRHFHERISREIITRDHSKNKIWYILRWIVWKTISQASSSVRLECPNRALD